MVRAKRIVQQHREPMASASFTSPLANYAEMQSFTYAVTFAPGPMGFQPEPCHGALGCRVLDFVDGGPEKPGQARMSNQIEVGDFIVEINDEVVSHLKYDDIVDQLKAKADMPRKILFRRRLGRGKLQPTVSPSKTWPNNQLLGSPNTGAKPSKTMEFNAQGNLTPIVSRPTGFAERDENTMTTVSSILFMDPSQVATTTTLNAIVRTDSWSTEQPKMPNNVLSRDDSASRDGANTHLVLDINDNIDTSQSIEDSYAGSPAKTKNMIQEDLEMGMGLKLASTIGNPNIWRNMFSSVSKLGGIVNNGSRESKEVIPAESITTVIPSRIQEPNIIEDCAIEEKKDDFMLMAEPALVCTNVLSFWFALDAILSMHAYVDFPLSLELYRID
jgi:hypothetical protein